MQSCWPETLQQVSGRKADDWRPANTIESFETVRRRLCEEPDWVRARLPRTYCPYVSADSIQPASSTYFQSTG
ncbi:hypothetical protein GCM10010377_52540 [Streptomyces viridiviolaceus]|uniref:Uncharacterized protein n=1 Tax=Streptomyces viridiviolaceus TaxID=68282 RepID=A0ABW2E643_9ACTN|nr:hypothetical protein [Streptomyces viridiviolaceus]GHB54839.1 hypothetical protein GCM10010377_52540 [Streptomyces viridiviolaceus]